MQKRLSLAITAVVIFLSACGGGSTVSSDTHDHGSSESDITAGVWPPQLSGMSNQKLFAHRSRAAARDSVMSAARSTVLKNPVVLESIGERYAAFDASLGDAKGGDAASFTFYNYTTNETVMASLSRDGDVLVNVLEAKLYQPAENADEKEQAISLAEQSFNAAGYNTAALTGTAMLAYPPTEPVAADVGSFYPQRMLYVTFGDGDGELPLYRALVNLSDAVVVSSGLIN